MSKLIGLVMENIFVFIIVCCLNYELMLIILLVLMHEMVVSLFWTIYFEMLFLSYENFDLSQKRFWLGKASDRNIFQNVILFLVL